MEVYCAALLNQEKSLEDLQRHLRTTEELFRESVKRKNQQLDLLQSEVRRLKTSVGVRDEAASLQIDAALNAQASELRRANEKLAMRDAEVDALTKQVSQLKLELADERARRNAEKAKDDEASTAVQALQQREEEVEGLRSELFEAQEAAARLQAASAEAEAALVVRDAELQALRERDSANLSGVAASELVEAELAQLRAKAEEAERAIAEERQARLAAEEHAEALERGREELEQQAAAEAEALEAERDEIARELDAVRAGGGGGDEGAAHEVQRLQAKVEQLQQQLQQASQASIATTAATSSAAAPSSLVQRDASPVAKGITVPCTSTAGGGAGGGGGGAGPPPSSAASAALASGSGSRAAGGGGIGGGIGGGGAAGISSGGSGGGRGGLPQVRSLVIAGEPIIGVTLTAQAAFLEADETASRYEWFRGESTLLGREKKYGVTSDDLGHELTVRVTPVSTSGAVGDPLRATASAPVAIPGNVHGLLREWHDLGQKGFTNCSEGGQDRQVLFAHKKIKLQDKSGKTINKSDGFANVAVRFHAGNQTGFTLTIGSRRGMASYELNAPPGVRDLISLVLQVFADPTSLERMPVAPTSGATGTSSLHLSAVGSLNQHVQGGTSPSSSITSEQPSLADVEEGSSKTAGAGASKLKGAISMATAGKRLSFPVRSKKK